MKDESQQQVPPGIVALASPEDKTKILTFEGDKEMYSHWITSLFKNQRFTIHTISVDDKEWSIKDKTANGFTIKSFEWEGHTRNWQATFEEPSALFPKTVKTLEKLLHPSQPKPNYERLEEMLDRSVSQPGKPEIQKMAEEYADTCFVHGSFRWEHVVKMYLKGISDYRLWLLQKSQMESETEIDGIPPRKPYSADLKTPIKDAQPALPEQGNEENSKMKAVGNAITALMAADKRIYELEAELAALKSLPKEPSEEEINAAAKSECLRILGIHDPIGAGHKLFKAALQWLSSYKQTKS